MQSRGRSAQVAVAFRPVVGGCTATTWSLGSPSGTVKLPGAVVLQPTGMAKIAFGGGLAEAVIPV